MECLCPVGSTIVRSPTVDEFQNALSNNLRFSNFLIGTDDGGQNVSIESIQERDPIPCLTGDVVTFERRISIKYEIICELIEDDLPALQQALVATYNELQEDYYCDSTYRRQLISAQTAAVGPREDGKFITVDFVVEASCIGCDPTNITIFDDYDNGDLDRRHLLVQSKIDSGNIVEEDIDPAFRRHLESCFCNSDAVPDRSPSEVEFIDTYQRYILDSRAVSDLFCVVSTGSCIVDTPFRVILLVSFDVNTTTVPTQEIAFNQEVIINLDSIEDAVFESVVSLYEADLNNDETCNSDFREFDSVSDSKVVDFDPNEFFRARKLQVTQNDIDGLFGNVSDTTDTTDAPTASPTVDPTLPLGDISLLVVLEGTCSDCEDDLVTSFWPAPREGRLLQDGVDSEGTPAEPSKCFCPVDKNRSLGFISSEDLAITLQENMETAEESDEALDVSFLVQLSTGQCRQLLLASALQETDADSFCGEEPVTDAPTVSFAPSSAPTREVCEIELAVEFPTNLLVEISLDDGQALNEIEIAALGEEILTAFNIVSNITFSTCEEEYRQVGFFFVDETLATRRLGSDHGRRDQEVTTQTVLYGISGLCETCDLNSTIFIPDRLSEDQFLTTIQNATDDLSSVSNSIDFFQEVVLFECTNADELQFTEVVIVDFEVNCTDFTDEQLREIEKSFVDEYNFLNRFYCDPHRRIIQEARVVRIGEQVTPGETPMEIQVVATCVDCNSSFSIYDIPTSIITSQEVTEGEVEGRTRQLSKYRSSPSSRDSFRSKSDRSLQQVELCLCPANPVGARGIYEAEFIDAYTSAIIDLDLDCVDSVAECSFGTQFISGIVVDLGSNTTADDEEASLEVLEQSCKCKLRILVIILFGWKVFEADY